MTEHTGQICETSFPAPFRLKHRLLQVVPEIRVLERHIRAPKVGRLQRVPRSSREALVRDQRLRAADGRREPELVVHGGDAAVLDERARPAQVGRRRGGEPAVRGRGNAQDPRVGLVGVVDPDDNAFPVVPVPKPGGGRVLLGVLREFTTCLKNARR